MVPRSTALLKVRRGISGCVGFVAMHAIDARGGDNRGMDIMLNGDSLSLGDAPTILDLLSAQGLADRRVAVEVNGEIVPRGRHAAHVLREGDRVEIVHALGGG